VVVNRGRGAGVAPREAFRDEAVAGGHRWASSGEALSYALKQARELIQRQPHRLHC
jgi:hypothetical protein